MSKKAGVVEPIGNLLGILAILALPALIIIILTREQAIEEGS